MIDSRNFNDVIDVIDQFRDRKRWQRIGRFQLVTLFGPAFGIVLVFLIDRILLRFQSFASRSALCGATVFASTNTV